MRSDTAPWGDTDALGIAWEDRYGFGGGNSDGKEATRAHTLAEIRVGRMKRGVCQCGSTKTEAHHHDYSKPLDVRWLCRACHQAAHRALAW